MTTNQTIDGVPRELAERFAQYAESGKVAEPGMVEGLRALLDAPVDTRTETVPKHKFDTLVQHCKRLDGEVAQARAHVNEITLYQQNAVWFWQHDGQDFLESLSCPIIIQPQQLRELLKGVSPAAQSQGEPVAQKYDDTLLPFVALMRKELHANAGKGDRPGWLSMSSDTCLLEIIYHFGKLQASVKRGDGDGMAEYGADVANMCMMLLDICGVINLVQHTEQPAPVAVVMPDRLTDNYGQSDQVIYAQGWNACVDELKRLNPSL